MPAWEELKADVRKDILSVRDGLNDTNPERTDYYYDYWKANPEIPWSLLASLVSRNAGYQMSDLARNIAKVAFAPLILPPGMGRPAVSLGIRVLQSLWAFLEVGNFLIFRDVSPALEAWKHAKLHPEHADKIFDLLDHPDFDADPWILAEWKGLFAKRGSLTAADIQRHTFALISNEQNQIEDRLVKGAASYLGPISGITNEITTWYNRLGLTILCFPEATSPTNPTPQHLLLYTVGNFASLDARINVGRDLFVGLFGSPARRTNIEAWVNANPVHHGTRADYNEEYYDTDPDALWGDPFAPIATDETYSPPLVRWQDQEAAWYRTLPRKEPVWAHLYRDPVPLPNKVPSRGATQISSWLSPLSAPVAPLTPADLDDLEEIVDEDWQWP
jgi:Protein of unknown function (DUF2515)